MACLNPSYLSLNLTLAKLLCLLLLILYLVAEIAGSPVQIQSTPFEEVVNNEEKVVLYCKTTGVHLHWRVNSFTPGIFNGDEKVGAIKERTQNSTGDLAVYQCTVSGSSLEWELTTPSSDSITLSLTNHMSVIDDTLGSSPLVLS